MIEWDIVVGFSGVVFVVVKDGCIIKKEVYGYSKKYEGLELLRCLIKMKICMMFDLVLNIKMYVINFVL